MNRDNGETNNSTENKSYQEEIRINKLLDRIFNSSEKRRQGLLEEGGDKKTNKIGVARGGNPVLIHLQCSI